jgi:hypothetical protein
MPSTVQRGYETGGEMIEGWIGAVLSTLVARGAIVKLGARGTPLAIFDTLFALVVGAGALLIALRLLDVIAGALL